ncbi:MAG: LTA synthase family protein [Parabacteroides sp.]|nr:LTA synthase family protein [Parabacteroides sp.]
MKQLRFLILLFIAWLPVFALQKPVFLCYHHALSAGYRLNDFLQVTLHGLKLDSTIAGYLTALPLLLTLIAVWLPGTWLSRAMKVYFGSMALLIAAIFAIDLALYTFWGFRLDATLFFYLKSPSEAMASVPVGLFVSQCLVFLSYAALIYYGLKTLLRICPTVVSPTSLRQRMVHTTALLLLGGLLFIPIRGGVTTSTANVGMVYFSQDQFLNHSAINPCFSLISSLSKQQDFAAQFDFFPEEERAALFEQLMAPTPLSENEAKNTPNQSLLRTDRPNILLVLLESFSANAIEAFGGEPDITPNLNRLSQEGVCFTNLYANSFRTDRGLVAVLNGYLAQPTTSIMKYPAKSQTLPAIARSLNHVGYQSDVLYGGDINFTNMRSFFYSSGYSQLTSDQDFPLADRLSKWGANDDVTFERLYQMIAQRPTDRPWFTTFLTLSSHEPFEVPYHRLAHPYLNTVAFTDSCLGHFINRFKQLPSWQNSLVILVSDHGFRYPDGTKDYEPKRYHIPMLWLGGAIAKPCTIPCIGNQTDLAATLLHQLGLSAEEFRFSKDLMDPQTPQQAFYTFQNGFGWIDESGISVFDNEGNKPLIEEPQASSAQRLTKGKVLLQTLYDDLGSR